MRRLPGPLFALALAACGREADPSLTRAAASPSGTARASLVEIPPATSPSASKPAHAAHEALGASAGRDLPRPGRKRMDEAVRQNGACVACHEREAAEWRGSRHRTANTNAAYARAFAVEPSSFCRGCHAPESDPSRPPPRAVSELGVGCVSCHLADDGAIVAAERPGAPAGEGDEPAPHPLRRSRDLAGDGACRGCHEFPFPHASSRDDDGAFMQTTAREHQRSASRDKPCAGCHMPEAGGHRAHGFAEVRDPAWLRERLTATAEWGDDGSILLTLAQPEPGHGFPTGDLFRRLEVGAELVGPKGQVLARDARHLARHFVLDPPGPGRALLRDDRVMDEPRQVDLALSAPPGSEASYARWWVRLQRVATVGAGHDPTLATIESEVLLHQGTLPLPARPLRRPIPMPPRRLPAAPPALLALLASSALLSAGPLGCRPRSEAAPERDSPSPSASAPPGPAALVAPSASVGPTSRAPAEVPTFTLQPFDAKDTQWWGLHTVEGAVVASHGRKAGKLTENGIEWLDKQIPEGMLAFGDRVIQRVSGRYPDALDTLSVNRSSRMPQPSYYPLTGKGAEHVVALGGEVGWIVGMAQIDATTLIATYVSREGSSIVTVRPPALARFFTSPQKAGCKPGEIWQGDEGQQKAAVAPSEFASTRDGVLVSVGKLCEKRAVTAEIWDKGSTTSRLVDLGAWVKGMPAGSALLRGSGNELFLFSTAGAPLLRFENGSFEPIDPPNDSVKRAFVSLDGKLHAFDGQTLFRRDDKGWQPVGRLAWPRDLREIATDGAHVWATVDQNLYRLGEGKSVAYREGCSTPFVFLYDVSADNPKSFSFPTTRKALAKLEGAADLSLVDFDEDGKRRLGLPVTSKEQGEAVIAHLKTTMKDEKPALLCFEPKGGRKVAVTAKP